MPRQAGVRCPWDRSLGGWSATLSLRKDNERPLTDERVLGAENLLKRLSKKRMKRSNIRVYGAQLKGRIKEAIEKACEREGVNVNEVISGSRRGIISGRDLISQLRQQRTFIHYHCCLPHITS
jgi:hypothetical protein